MDLSGQALSGPHHGYTYESFNRIRNLAENSRKMANVALPAHINGLYINQDQIKWKRDRDCNPELELLPHLKLISCFILHYVRA